MHDPIIDVAADVCHVLRGINFGGYLNADDGAMVCGVITDEDIIASVATTREGEGDKDTKNDCEAPVRPCASDLVDALNRDRLHFSFEEEAGDDFWYMVQLKDTCI